MYLPFFIFDNMNKTICLWSCPRNVSTALMYSFAERDDTEVFDEPLYAHYLHCTGVIHPGRDDVLKSQNNDGNSVVENVILKNKAPITFHKLMTHFLVNIDTSFLNKVINILFIRDPREIIYSYSKVIANPTIDDIGLKKQFDLYHILLDKNISPIVLDSKYLLYDPKFILKELCLIIGINFMDNMLSWPRGGRKEDGVWSKFWYKNLHNSTGFKPYTKRKYILEGNNLKLAEDCLNYYNFLTEKSIKV